MLGFLFPLGFYDDLSVCSKYLKSGSLLCPGLTHYRPMGQDPSGTTYRRPVMPIFTPLVAPFTLWSVMLEGTDQWGDGSIFLGVDGSMFLGLTVLKEDDANYDQPDKLSSIYKARHVLLYDWIFSRIEVLLRLLCTSYIYIYIYIYITLLLFHFSTFQPNHIVRAPLLTLLDSDPFNCCTRH